MMPMTSAASLARNMSCVDISIAFPSSRNDFKSPINSNPAWGSSPDVGSSRSIAGAFFMMAIAMPHFCRIPLENPFSRLPCASSPRPTLSRASLYALLEGAGLPLSRVK